MRKLTKKEIDDAPDWAVSYSISELNCGGVLSYHERHYGYTLPLPTKNTGKKFDVSDAWVSVDDRLPPNQTRVLTIDKLGVVRVLMQDLFEALTDWYDDDWHDNDRRHFEDSHDVTHWQPLPGPPKLKAEDLS